MKKEIDKEVNIEINKAKVKAMTPEISKELDPVKAKAKAKPPASSLSTNKTLLILEYLALADGQVRLQDLSEHIKMPQPSVLRYLNSLIANNYVFQDEETLKYGITWKIKRLSNDLDSHLNMRAIISPFLVSLAREFNVGASLAREKDFRSIYIDFIDRPGKKLSLRRIGVDAPIHATSSGRLLLSKYSDDVLKSFLSQRPLEQATERTVTEVAALLKIIDQTRQNNYATEDEECELNNKCVSVPIYSFTDTIYAAISIFDEPQNMTDDRIQKVLLPRLQEVAKIISTRLGSDLFEK